MRGVPDLAALRPGYLLEKIQGNVAVQVFAAPPIASTYGEPVLPLPQSPLHVPVPGFDDKVTWVTVVGIVYVQVLVELTADTEQVGGGENCGTPATDTDALLVEGPVVTMIVSPLPLPPPVPPEVHAALVGSVRHKLTPLRFTVAVGEPLAVANVQEPLPALP